MESFVGKRAVKLGKTALIVLLTASALLLGMRTRLFDDIFKTIPFFGNVAVFVRGSGAADSAPSGTILKEAAQPLTIVITNEDGERYGVRYDTALRNAVYDRTSSILGEALGSATASREISEDEWRAALSGPGVYFEYISPVTLSILDGWLIRARIPSTAGDASLRRVFVAFGEDRSSVYYQNNDNGLFFAADTASSAGKAQELEIYSPNGALFAFETGIPTAENAPYTIIMQESLHSEIRVLPQHTTDELVTMTLDALGHGNETYTPRFDSEGALVHVGIQFNITTSAFGHVAYRRTDMAQPDSTAHILSDSQAIEMARLVVGDTINSVGSSAEVFFEKLEYGISGARTVFFGYYIAGGRIHLQDDRYAAWITIVDGTITELELVYRSFAFTGEQTRLLPERQALASAGGEFILSYTDTGVERLQPSWTLYK